MIRKLVAMLSLVLLVPHNAYAQQTLGNITGMFPCFNFEELRNKLREDNNEIPFVSSEGVTTLLNMQSSLFEMARHDVYLFVNPETYNYTLVFKINAGETGLGCIASVGGNFGPVIQDEGI